MPAPTAVEKASGDLSEALLPLLMLLLLLLPPFAICTPPPPVCFGAAAQMVRVVLALRAMVRAHAMMWKKRD